MNRYPSADSDSTTTGIDGIASLNELWEFVEKFNVQVDPTSALPPVMGGGCATEPKLACVFINPTYRNTSTRDTWNGPRLPFIGTKAVWAIFMRAGLFPSNLYARISARTDGWDESFASEVYQAITDREMYFTNLVKWTGLNGNMPSRNVTLLYSRILSKELYLVKPRAVVAFGVLPYRVMAGESVHLGRVLDDVRRGRQVVPYRRPDLGFPIYPCYFPIGRGRPSAAVEILRALAQQRGILIS